MVLAKRGRWPCDELLCSVDRNGSLVGSDVNPVGGVTVEMASSVLVTDSSQVLTSFGGWTKLHFLLWQLAPNRHFFLDVFLAVEAASFLGDGGAEVAEDGW